MSHSSFRESLLVCVELADDQLLEIFPYLFSFIILFFLIVKQKSLGHKLNSLNPKLRLLFVQRIALQLSLMLVI